MSRRLQIFLQDAEHDQLKRVAARQNMTLSEWARQALRAASRAQDAGAGEAKLVAVRAAVRHEFPTADMEQMLAEIERGYGGELPS